MIRVTFLVDAMFLGGAERYVSLLIEGLDGDRFAPSVLMRPDSEISAGLREWGEAVEARGVPVRRVPMAFPFRPLHAPGIVRALRALYPDIVHVNVPGPYDGQMGLAPLLARLAGVRGVVTTEHLPMVPRLWKRAALKGIGMRFVDRVITVCSANVAPLMSIQRVPVGKIRVVPNALPVSYGCGAGREGRALGGDQVVAFIGNLFEHKGPHRVVEAFARANCASARLLLVGDGPMRTACVEVASRFGVVERVDFAGVKSIGEVEQLLSGVDVLVHPSTMEGMPYVVLEAMASGVPVIAGRVWGMCEEVEHGVSGILVDPLDIATIAQSISDVLRDRERQAAMGAAARTRFEKHFTLTQQTETMGRIYDDVVGVSS